MKKSKKILALVCSATAAFAAAGLFAACADEPVATHEHEWGEWTVTTEATCTDEGTETRVCALDGTHKESRKIDALDHAWGDWADETDATCTAAKTQKRVCSRNHEHTQTQSVGEPLGHAMADTWQYTLPETGKKGAAVKTCTRTGCEEEERVELPELTNEDYEVSTTATCTAAGKTTYTIVIDEETFSFSVDTAALGHRNLTKTDEVSANCTQNGTQVYWTCSCGQKFADAQGEQEIDEPVAIPAGHGTLTATQEIPSTCTTAGTAAYWTCEVCKQKFGDAQGTQKIDAPAALPLAAHTPVAKAAVPSTCKTEGTAAYWECGVCEKKFANEACTEDITAPETLPLAAHTYEVTVTDPNGTAKGKITKACPVCGDSHEFTFDEKAQSGSAIPAVDKSYYIYNTLTDTTKTAINIGFQNFVLEKGVYEFTIQYLDDAVPTFPTNGRGVGLNARYSLIKKVNDLYAAADNYTNNVEVTNENGKLSKIKIIVDGTTIAVGSKLNIMASMPCTPNVETGYILGTTFAELRILVADANEIRITEANVFADEYTFTSATAKKYSLTVPAGVSVTMNDEGFIDGGDSESFANFDAKANTPVKFVFSSSQVGTYSVSIGDARTEMLKLNETKEIAIQSSGVKYEVQAGLEEKEYILTVRINRTTRQYISVLVGDDAPNLGAVNAGRYSGSGTLIQVGHGFPAVSNDKYSYSGVTDPDDATCTIGTIRIRLKGGDVVWFCNGTNCTCECTLSEVTE